MNVFLTFDVEVWCDGWSDLDGKFEAQFSRYVYGHSRHGNFALPKTLEILDTFGIRATFFVESLFAYRFGVEPLAEIIELIRSAKQDIQLHVHPEWADETTPRLIGGSGGKRPLLSQYSLDEQTDLIAKGKDMLKRAGAPAPRAFRAGSYGCNRDTFIALARNDIAYDSSLNLARPWSGADLSSSERREAVSLLEGTIEIPITCYRSWQGRLRQVQVGSTSFGEFRHLLNAAVQQGRTAFVIVSHNFEMLVPGASRRDAVVARRFTQLCRFLAEHRDRFITATFDDAPQAAQSGEPAPLASAPWKATLRNMEQAWRRMAR